MPGDCHFQMKWKDDPDFKEWIGEGDSENEAKCRVCRKTIKLGAMGVGALRSHMGQKRKPEDKPTKHEENMKALRGCGTLFQFQRPKGTAHSVNEKRTTNPVCPPSTSNTTLDYLVKKDDVLRAELMWCLKMMKSHYSYNSCEGLNGTFAAMFPDSDIAKKFSLSERKSAYLICFGIAPYVKTLFRKKIGDEPYVLLFDESLNKKTQYKQMDVHIRVWDNDLVKSLYYGSSGMEHARAEDILASFKGDFDLNLGKVFQLSMDGPNVNWKFFSLLEQDIAKEYNVSTRMMNLGSCGLHILHNAFKSGAVASGWNVGSLLSSLYNLLHDAPARRKDFKDYGETELLPVKFCNHRWLENVPCAERAISLWPSMVKYVTQVRKKKSTEPTCASYKLIKEVIDTDKHMVIPKLMAFLSIARQVTPFLTDYQTDRPMLPFLAEDMGFLLKDLMQRFSKKETLKSADTLATLVKVDVSAAKNHCEASKVNVGFLAKNKLQELKATGKISDRRVLEFKVECQAFLVALVKLLLKKAPITYLVVRNMNCLNPNRMATHPDQCKVNFSRILTVLYEAKQVQETDCDDVVQQFSDFLECVVKKSSSEFSEFNHRDESHRVDALLHRHMAGNTRYEQLWSVIKKFLLLSHGQASVERGFSVNKQIEVENLKQESYEAQRLVCELLRLYGSVEEVPITKELMKSASAAHCRYKTHLEEQRRIRESSEKASKRKNESLCLETLKTKKRLLEADIVTLNDSANKMVEQAEKGTNLTEVHALIAKSVSFRKTAAEKSVEVNTLEKDIQAQVEVVKGLM